MLVIEKPATRGRSGLIGVQSLGGAAEHQQNSGQPGFSQQRRPSPADLFCAADRLERLAGRGDGENLVQIAARFRSWALEVGRGGQ